MMITFDMARRGVQSKVPRAGRDRGPQVGNERKKGVISLSSDYSRNIEEGDQLSLLPHDPVLPPPHLAPIT